MPDFATLKPVNTQQASSGSQPDFSSLTSSASKTTTPQPQQSLADQIWSGLAAAGNTISSVLPGKQLGNAIGTSVAGIGQAIQQHSLQPALQAGAENNSNFGKIVGDTVNAVATPASLLVGGPEGPGLLNAAARVGTNVATGAALGGANAAAQGKDITQGAEVGGATGGALSTAGEGISALLNQLPSRLVRQALPKLTPGNEQYALENTKVGSLQTLLQDSKSSIQNLGGQIKQILSHPDYATHTGEGDAAIQKTLAAFPNSDYTPSSVVSSVKSLVPEQSKLVDKVAAGTATLSEKNDLRKSIDPIIKKVFTDNPQVSSTKQIGAEFANSLRGEVQSQAPETQPVFAKLSKEIDLRNALQTMNKRVQNNKALGLYDITAALGGLSTAGPVGALGAIAAEKAARSPAVGLAAAKAAQVGAKAAPTIANAFKMPAIAALGGQQ